LVPFTVVLFLLLFVIPCCVWIPFLSVSEAISVLEALFCLLFPSDVCVSCFSVIASVVGASVSIVDGSFSVMEAISVLESLLGLFLFSFGIEF